MAARWRSALLGPEEGLGEPPAVAASDRLRRRLRRGRRRLEIGWTYRGLDVSEDVAPGHFAPDNATYVPSDPAFVRRSLRRLRPGPADVLVDFGCGKGSALVLAARHSFARVVGVELDERLAAVARRNLARPDRRRRCERVEVVAADALVFEVPDDMTIAYFFLPFVGPTFRTVLERIVASRDAYPRRVRLVYVCPHDEAAVQATGRFSRIGEIRLPLAGGDVRWMAFLYEVTAPPADPAGAARRKSSS